MHWCIFLTDSDVNFRTMELVLETGFNKILQNIEFQPQAVQKEILFNEANHIVNVKEFRITSTSCRIEAQVIRQTSVNSTPYTTKLMIDSSRHVTVFNRKYSDLSSLNIELRIVSIEIESMSRYVSPINPAVFPVLALVLLGIGIFFTAWFFVYEVTSTKFTRDIFKELLVSLVAALFSGFGVLFLMLWVGIYV
ncbi:hypothetical protein PV327_005008 [Microctonus hyperodae]|uniref:Dolichyl-diphosphooligosaccharide-protein glycosyltransferase subunit TMEM258 n=1 Tax=Microctonus hyperodae TaxID=165561 RepID=A0AA39KNA8_MICHY|nr:hypothetical protein PV327_005008 [Microctonus hyperodae]